METSKKWRVVIIAIAIVDILLIAAIGYVALREDEEEARPPYAVISIRGSELASSKYVDHGSGTLSDPYVITGLDVELTRTTTQRLGMMISGVEDHLIISGTRLHADYARPGFGLGYQFTGILVSWSKNVTILDCRFENLTMGVELSYSSVNISYNSFWSCWGGVLMEERNAHGAAPGTVISGNSFEYTDYCVEALGSWDFTTVTDVLMKNNSMRWYQCALGIYGIGHNFTILGNYFYDGGDFAIEAGKLYESYIAENRMYGHIRDGGGISLSNSEEVRIERNWIETGGPAISIQWSENITISNNSIDSYLGSTLPMQFGVFLENSVSVNVTFNEITERTVGVVILSSSPSSSKVWIHHNDFEMNFIQALDNSAMENHWDDGAGAGNYWEDYDGSDADHDGIGDSPYMIDSDTWDSYPLLVPPV